jgi:hypothetical protein
MHVLMLLCFCDLHRRPSLCPQHLIQSGFQVLVMAANRGDFVGQKQQYCRTARPLTVCDLFGFERSAQPQSWHISLPFLQL